MFVFLFGFQTMCISGEREERPVATVFSSRHADVRGNCCIFLITASDFTSEVWCNKKAWQSSTLGTAVALREHLKLLKRPVF